MELHRGDRRPGRAETPALGLGSAGLFQHACHDVPEHVAGVGVVGVEQMHALGLGAWADLPLDDAELAAAAGLHDAVLLLAERVADSVEDHRDRLRPAPGSQSLTATSCR